MRSGGLLKFIENVQHDVVIQYTFGPIRVQSVGACWNFQVINWRQLQAPTKNRDSAEKYLVSHAFYIENSRHTAVPLVYRLMRPIGQSLLGRNRFSFH